MHTIHSILIASALFCTFMVLGMETAAGDTLESNPPKGVVAPGDNKADSCIVQDNKEIRLMLLLHHPSRAIPAKPCRAPQLVPHAETVGPRGDAA